MLVYILIYLAGFVGCYYLKRYELKIKYKKHNFLYDWNDVYSCLFNGALWFVSIWFTIIDIIKLQRPVNNTKPPRWL